MSIVTRNADLVSRRTLLSYSITLGVGGLAGAIIRSRPSVGRSVLAASTEIPDPTATREAELAELHALQTEVAQPKVCTPAPTETPVPTATPTEVPLAATGVPLSYLGVWTITVVGISPAPIINDAKPAGKFMQVNLTLAHSARDAQFISVADFLLTDSQGRFAAPLAVSSPAMVDQGWQYAVDPGVTRNRAIIFDVAADAGDSFILESKADPTFRVAMTVEQRG
jgi:hypothetical protein